MAEYPRLGTLLVRRTDSVAGEPQVERTAEGGRNAIREPTCCFSLSVTD